MEIIAGLMLLTALIYTVNKIYGEKKEYREYSSLAEDYFTLNEAQLQKERAGLPVDGNRVVIAFDALAEINNDVVGWIYISDTDINYPITQGQDNSYYLDRSFTDRHSDLGSIFLDCELDMEKSDVIILYGHNMGSSKGGMFTDLTRYDDISNGQKSNIITTRADNTETVWSVFAVVHADVSTEVKSIYRKHDFGDKEQFDEYIQLVKHYQLYETGILPEYGQKILMLSTCIGEAGKNMRRIVFATATESLRRKVLINERKYDIIRP